VTQPQQPAPEGAPLVDMASPWANIRTVDNRPVTAAPETCLIVCIGDDFMEGTLESIVMAAMRLRAAGISPVMLTIKSVCIVPNEGVNMMRNYAAIKTLEHNADWMFMIDNDFRLDDPDTILKLIRAGKQIVCPWYDQRGINGNLMERVSSPMLYPNQGLVPLTWVSVNCVLFHQSVFRVAGPEIFSGPLVTNHEEYIFAKLRTHGVRLWQDTDVYATMLRNPTKVWANMGLKCPNPDSPEAVAKSQELERRLQTVLKDSGYDSVHVIP